MHHVELLLLQLYVLKVYGSHFMGATIRWKSDPDVDNQATFYWKAGWRISLGPCSDTACTTDDIGRLGTYENPYGGKDMYCHIGCTETADQVMLANSNYWITAVSVADNYEMGENEFTHTFGGAGPYKIGLQGNSWRALSVTTEDDPYWSVLTTVIFGDRSDTGRPNNSPMTAAFPIYNLQFDCEGKIKLPLLDPDGDTVRCRWGNSFEECGDVCDALPGVVIDEETCELTITPDTASTYVSDGWYVGAIMLEDFPRSEITLGGQTYTPDMPLSAVPLAFLVNTPSFGTTCSAVPVFVSPTPDADTVYYLEPHQSIGIAMYAVNQEDTNAVIAQIDVVSPSGVITSTLADDEQGRTGVKYRVAYWTPTTLQSGANTICFMALDTTGKYSEYRCVYIYANDVDECLSDPCQNGGTCNNLENIYTCTCAVGTTGYNCETDSTDDCTAGGGSCSADSTCVDGINSFTCNCDAGYDGQFCDNDIDECANSPCQNGGTCTDSTAAYTCACVTGYEGSVCDTVTDMCNPQPCQNSGTCYNIIGDYVCVCDAGYTGDDCETDINDCSSSPCYNGGTCTDAVAGFSCSCVGGWSGSSCQDYDDPCSGTPCQNGGTCLTDCSAGLSSAASYSCVCGVHYSGPHCEESTTTTTTTTEGPTTSTSTSISTSASTTALLTTTTMQPVAVGATAPPTATDHCASSPCENGGTCTGLKNRYTCTCMAGYHGKLCESELPPTTPSCYASRCSCSSNLDKSGIGIKVSCSCTECSDGVQGNTTTVLEGRTACLRNIYVMILTVLVGIILPTVCFAAYFLVIDLRRRYNILLNGSCPDGENEDGYGSGFSLRGLSQVPSRNSNSSLSKVGVADEPPKYESRFSKKAHISKSESPVDDEDTQPMAPQSFTNNTYGAFMLSNRNKASNLQGNNTIKVNSTNNSVWSTSSTSQEQSAKFAIGDDVESLMDESIEEEPVIQKEREEKKRKKDKKEKKEKKEKKQKEEKKASKKKDRKEKRERRRGWD